VGSSLVRCIDPNQKINVEEPKSENQGQGFHYNSLENNAIRINVLDTDMFHNESQKSIYFGVKRSKFKVMRHKDGAVVDLCTLVSAGFF